LTARASDDRGNARQAIFDGGRDNEAFLERLRKASHVFEIRFNAYCLTGHHLHLLVETRKPNLSQFGQRLFAPYTLWYNRKHSRIGARLGGVSSPGTLQAIRQAESESPAVVQALCGLL